MMTHDDNLARVQALRDAPRLGFATEAACDHIEDVADSILDAVLPAYRARLLSEVFTRLTRSLSYEVGEQGMRDAIAIVKTMYDEETP